MFRLDEPPFGGVWISTPFWDGTLAFEDDQYYEGDILELGLDVALALHAENETEEYRRWERVETIRWRASEH